MINRRSLLAGLTASVALGGVGLAGTPANAQTETTNSEQTLESQSKPTEIDIGFCVDMSTHHVQALAMCQRVLGQDTGDAVQAAAAEVLQNQAIEIGMMRAWLTDWGASTAPPESVMAWMGANDGQGMPLAMMPGYASAEELQELSLAEGEAQGKRWLELMRDHHVGGVAMAEAASEMAQSPKVVRIANTQVITQTFEIAQYDLLLA